MNKVFFYTVTLFLIFGSSLEGAQFKRRDDSGHYYFRCDMTSGRSVRIVITNKGFYTKGGEKPHFRSIENLRKKGFGGLKRSNYNARQIASYSCGEISYLKLEFRTGPEKSAWF
ncbi:MAG: hypothetical protein GY786_06620 [Proteobacteria bacterium]|nr:hypothetical protein [Pseudomonadota bacterium]